MKNNTLWNSLCVLITIFLVVIALFRGAVADFIIIAALAIWLIFTVSYVIIHLKKQNSAVGQSKIINENSILKKIVIAQIEAQISKTIHECSNKAAWKWDEADIIAKLIDGAACHIKISGIDDYNFANVFLDKNDSLIMEFGKLVSTVEVKKTSQKPTDPKKETEVIEEWFENIGKEVLACIITDLNESGYDSFILNSAGDVIVNNDDGPQVLAYSLNIPRVKLGNLGNVLKRTLNLKPELQGGNLSLSIK